LDISPIWTHLITAEVKKITTSSTVDWVGKFVFLVLVPYGVFHLSSDDIYSDSSLVQGLIRVELLMFCLNSRRYFALCLACIPYLVLAQVSGDRD
jgi:hypothetical protein